jgi:hypothetical protein
VAAVKALAARSVRLRRLYAAIRVIHAANGELICDLPSTPNSLMAVLASLFTASWT